MKHGGGVRHGVGWSTAAGWSAAMGGVRHGGGGTRRWAKRRASGDVGTSPEARAERAARISPFAVAAVG